jgi:hypothetical protein
MTDGKIFIASREILKSCCPNSLCAFAPLRDKNNFTQRRKARRGRTINMLFILALFCTFSFADDTVKTTERSFVKLAEGVYAIRHKDAPDTFP